MPAKSVAQRRFMGMVRATQKGEMDNPSPELKRAAGDMSAKAVNKFAKTKEKNLPDKVEEDFIPEEAPTMSAGNGGFSGSADANGPTAGYDPMMGVSKLTGKKPKCKKRIR